MRDELAHEIIEQVKSCTPQFFERLVVELLVNMGYGGSMQDAGMAVDKGGEERATYQVKRIDTDYLNEG